MAKSKKYAYRIVINDGRERKDPYVYRYSQTRDIQLHIGAQKAVILFEQSSKKEIEDLTSLRMKLFRDAFRKVYLLHALKQGRGLIVKTLHIQIGDEAWDFDSESRNFPFLFSVIGSQKLNLNPEWEVSIPLVLQTTKSKKDVDYRFCAMFAFLSAKGKDNTMDRFSNLWTAMNAYGNYLGASFEKAFRKEYETESNTKAVDKELAFLRQDKKVLSLIGLLQHRTMRIFSRKETDELWKHYYRLQNELVTLEPADYETLYELSRQRLTGNPAIPEQLQVQTAEVNASEVVAEKQPEIPERLQALIACEDHFGQPFFLLMILDYPYYLRCNYLHGSFSTMLFPGYNDHELASLKVINYYLERFLNQELPKLFRDDYWNAHLYEDMKDCVRVMSGKNDKTGGNRFDEAVAKLVI